MNKRTESWKRCGQFNNGHVDFLIVFSSSERIVLTVAVVTKSSQYQFRLQSYETHQIMLKP